MGPLPAGLPPLPPQLGTLRSTLDQRAAAREPLLGFDWGVPGAGGEEYEAWGVDDGAARGVGARLRMAAEAVGAAAAEMWEFARKDPRKPVFAAKVAVALALITLLVFLREPSDIVSHSVWAILTVVVVFEFSIGTLPLDQHSASARFSQTVVIVAVNLNFETSSHANEREPYRIPSMKGGKCMSRDDSCSCQWNDMYDHNNWRNRPRS